MKVIVFHSYKGGTGKTTLALNTAINLACRGFKTLAVDADLNAPTFDSIFPDVKPKFRFNELFKKQDDNADTPQLKAEDLLTNSGIDPKLDIIFSDPKPKFGQGLLSMDKNFHTLALKKLIEAKKEFEKLGYEYLVMDTSPSMNLASINAIIIADATIMILRPNQYGISGTTFLFKELYSMLGTLKRKDFMIFNQVVPGTPKKFITKWEKHFRKELNVKTIGVILCNCGIALNLLHGNLILDGPANVKFTLTMDSIIDNLLKELSKE
ncbi:MAG: ParA family protein [Candidatus Heimdallarchaeota archaeon]